MSTPTSFSEYKKHNTEENRKVSNILSKNKSLTEILEDYKCFEGTSVDDDDELKYSSYLFNDCTREEKIDYYNETLKNISCLITPSIYVHTGAVLNWGDLYRLMCDPTYKAVDKAQRKVVYTTDVTSRPVGDSAWALWNGLQIIDLDIKDEYIALGLKKDIFDDLKKNRWFLGCCLSSSMKSIHIWTKIKVRSTEFDRKKTEYLCNFRHKYSILYIVLSKYAKKYGYTKDDIFRFMDMAMAKPQQGAFISADDKAMLNMYFKDNYFDKDFSSAYNNGIESIDWITHPDLRSTFAKLDWFVKNDNEAAVEVESLDNIDERDMKRAKGRQHYKHAQRWQLANTLTNLYGEVKALQVMTEICSGTDTSELRGDVKTAAIHNKPISIWAVDELNRQHGFNIKLKETEDEYAKDMEKVEDALQNVRNDEDEMQTLMDSMSKVNLYLRKDQYLGDIKDEILKNLGHVTLLEAGAGYGKTEMIKSLEGRVLLILPFTSTIKAKVEASETTKDWLYYYGNRTPTLEELLGKRSMAMTIDKFSHLNIVELDQANFDYIVIDESHLLLVSSYRNVMSPTIQRIANAKAKIIMMSGTPTGEMLFFQRIKYIKVTKEDVREKKFHIHFCPTNAEQEYEMCKAMADDIQKGIKILYPTNKGNMYYDTMTSLIQKILNSRGFEREIITNYYKKSNYGEQFMDDINVNKTIGKSDIIFCSTYLSVGVDICDRSEFSVYFSELWMAQEIEQFANRLRNNNLYIKLWLPMRRSNGEKINYAAWNRLDLGMRDDKLIMFRDFLKACNQSIERNNEEYKYDPIIHRLLGGAHYIKYDENECKYFIDETAYKLNFFQERYVGNNSTHQDVTDDGPAQGYAKQLPILKSKMMYFGYDIDTFTHEEEMTDEVSLLYEENKKACRRNRFDYCTMETRKFLAHINDDNIDCYKELLKGNYSLFKDNDPEKILIREDNDLYTNDIEILEKNTPIILNLYKYYNCDTIRDIYDYCIDEKQQKLNFSKLNRICSFVNIEYNWRKNKLDFSMIRYIKDAHEWAHENSITTQDEIDKWVGMYAVKVCNNVRDVVVEDNLFLERINEILGQLWRIIIIQSRPKGGTVTIKPFELLWERKFDIENLYGNWNTKQFFLQELIEEMHPGDDAADNCLARIDDLSDDDLPNFVMTPKKRLADVQGELASIVHKGFDYYDYSEKDGSNDRFLRKQQNTNGLAALTQDKDEQQEKKKVNADLFASVNDDPLPF